jgi:hypothetical protein
MLCSACMHSRADYDVMSGVSDKLPNLEEWFQERTGYHDSYLFA